MKRLGSAVTMAALAIAWSVTAEEITEFEARQDLSQDGLYLLFVSKSLSESAPMGEAFMVLGKGSLDALEFDIAYGMHLDGRPNLVPLTKEQVAEVRSSEQGQPVKVTAVRVDQAQYDQVHALLTEWSQIEEFDIVIVNAAIDVTQEAVSIIGYKRPYRSGLGTPHLMNYYADIAVINRKHKV